MRWVVWFVISVFSALTPLLPMTITAAAPPPQLLISQFKVTTKSGQFFMIYNAGQTAIDMGGVQLVYYNHYNLGQATSSKIISLQGRLQPSGYYLVNDGPYTLCYQMFVNSANLGLSTTKGTLQLQSIQQAVAGKPVITTLHDSVSWTKSSASGILSLPDEDNNSVIRRPIDTNNNPVITEPGGGTWVEVSPDASDPCVLTQIVLNQPPTVIQTSLLLLASTPPPVTIISRFAAAVQTGPYMPAGNIGLMAPVVNELLANPGSPATDANDEFIELYNPNDKSFELTNFSLQVGLNTPRKYKFAAGTVLKPKSFTPFYSDQTNLALSNSGSKAELVDPFGNVISKSDQYGSVKDDQAWALANNEWLLTSTPTPGQANVITGDQSAGTSAAGNSASKNSGNRSASGTNSGNTLGLNDETQAKVADIHPSTLAGVGALAVGYGAYEYRADVANKYRQFRSNRKNR